MSTAVFHAANIPFDWDALPDGPCVRGISAQPQPFKVMVVQLTVPHLDKPLTFKETFCVIDIPAHRFLLGHDLLVPLKFEVSAKGLHLTDPKTGVATLFPYARANVNTCSDI